MSQLESGAAKHLGREVRRTTQKSQRDIEREIQAMTRQEATIITDIKKFAKLNDKKALTMYAKQLAQLRESRTRLMGVKSTVGAVGMQVTAMASQAEAMAAVGRTAGVMAKVNAAMGPQAAGASMANFQRQMEVAIFIFTLFLNACTLMQAATLADAPVVEQIMNLNTEQLDEFLEDAFDDDEVEAEADEIVQETLLGIGIDLAAAMADAPTSKPASAQQLATGNTDTAESKAAADMEARFAALTAS